MEIKLIICRVCWVSGAKAIYSRLANNSSKTCWKLGDIPLPTSTNISFLIYLNQFNNNQFIIIVPKEFKLKNIKILTYGWAGCIWVSTRVLIPISNKITTVGSKICNNQQKTKSKKKKLKNLKKNLENIKKTKNWNHLGSSNKRVTYLKKPVFPKHGFQLPLWSPHSFISFFFYFFWLNSDEMKKLKIKIKP